MRRELTQLVVFFALAMGGCREEKTFERAPAPMKREGTSIAAKLDDGPRWDTALTYSARVDGAQKALLVDVVIAPGFHAYTEGETVGKPLALELAADSAVAGAGPVVYPKGVAKDLPVGRSMIVEGRAQILAPLALPDGSAGKSVTGTFRYQVCTDTACDRPRKVELAAAVP